MEEKSIHKLKRLRFRSVRVIKAFESYLDKDDNGQMEQS